MNDLKVIKKIAKTIGKRLKEKSFEEIKKGEFNNAYAVDDNKNLTYLDLSYNQLSDISPLKELKNFCAA